MLFSVKTGVNIFYHEKWVNKLNITLDSDSITVLSAVRQAIAGSDLEVSVWHNDLVILPGVKLLTELPAYEQIIQTNNTIEQKEQLQSLKVKNVILQVVNRV